MNEPGPAERPLRSPPVGAVMLAVLAGLFYAAELATIRDTGAGGGAGDSLAGAFVAVFTIVLWIVLAGLMLVAFKNGKMPEWAAIAALVLLPLSGRASFTAANLYAASHDWTWIVPVLVPPVIVVYALWIRIPALVAALSEQFASALAGAALVALIAASAWASYLDELAAPARQEKLQAAYKEQLAQDEKIAAENRARDEARFAALGPASPLRDYLEYVNSSDDRVPLAMEGARHALSRQADAVMLLGSEGGVSIDAQEMARVAGTISYGVLCGIHARVKRVYVEVRTGGVNEQRGLGLQDVHVVARWLDDDTEVEHAIADRRRLLRRRGQRVAVADHFDT